MLPVLQLTRLEPGTLVPLARSAHLDVLLHRQQWRLTTTALDRVATAVRDAARLLEH